MIGKVRKLACVEFSELHEVEGDFGRECVSPSGGMFPKHLICPFDLEKKTIVLPTKWHIEEDDSFYHFKFGDLYQTVFHRKFIRKIGFVDISYGSREFQPNQSFVLLTFRVSSRNKGRTDKLIQKYQSTKVIAGLRSKKIKLTIMGRSKQRERILWHHLYQLVIRKLGVEDFIKQFYEHNLVQKIPLSIQVEVLFPRQWAYFINYN